MAVLYNLLQITVYSTIVYAAVMLFKTFFKNNASPVLLQLVWLIFIARLLVPITPDPGFSLITLPSIEAQQETGVYLPAPSGTANAVFQAEPPVYYPGTDPASGATDIATQSPASSVPVDVLPRIDPARLLIMIWISGAAFFLLRFLIGSALLKKQLLRESEPPPPAVSGLAKAIQTELNLRTHVKIRVLDEISSPALSVNPHPVVMLPRQLLSCGEMQMEYALRHELTHAKRADHLVSILLWVLRAVYWFHPVVWLASRQISLDMETACDFMVVKRMNPAQRKNYAKTILNLYACEAQAGLMLGMGLNNTRTTAERRIRGIFMRPGPGNKSKLYAILLTAILLVACFTTACKPAFAAPARTVNLQDAGQQSNLTGGSPSTQVFQAPAEWIQTAQFGRLTIHADTPVNMPSADAYPIIKLKPAAFTQEQISEMVKYFAKATAWTDEEIKHLEETIQKTASQDSSGFSLSSTDGKFGMFDFQNIGDGEYHFSRFVFNTGTDGFKTETFYNQNKDWILAPGMRQVEYEKLFAGIQVSREDALSHAQKVMDDLGIRDMQLAGVQKAVLLKFGVNNLFENMPLDRGGWLFEYTRSAGGIPGYNPTIDMQPDPLSGLVPAYPMENVVIIVTDNGVEYFNWSAYCSVVETVNPNAELLPFERIQENLIDLIKTERSKLLEGDNMNAVDISVDSARLRMGMTPDTDDPEHADDYSLSLLTPVWVFDTHETYSLANGKTTDSYLTYMIDAQNGSKTDQMWLVVNGVLQQPEN